MTNSDRVALVTGCSQAGGIGVEVCKQLAENGITVFLTARDGTKAKDHADNLAGKGLDVYPHALDITSAESVDAIIQTIQKRTGRLDILVNNATGAMRDTAPVSATPLEGAQQVVNVTLFGTWRMTQAALPLLRDSANASIVNVSSTSGLHSDDALGLRSKRPSVTGPSYDIAKTALNALTVKVACELEHSNIKVNAVCPGFTATKPGMKERGARPVAEGAAGIVWAALLDEEGPSGGFYRDEKRQAW